MVEEKARPQLSTGEHEYHVSNLAMEAWLEGREKEREDYLVWWLETKTMAEMERYKYKISGNWVGERQCLDTSSEVIVHLKLCGTKYLGW